jgi:hypothetical protein
MNDAENRVTPVTRTVFPAQHGYIAGTKIGFMQSFVQTKNICAGKKD